MYTTCKWDCKLHKVVSPLINSRNVFVGGLPHSWIVAVALMMVTTFAK